MARFPGLVRASLGPIATIPVACRRKSLRKTAPARLIEEAKIPRPDGYDQPRRPDATPPSNQS